MTRLNGREPAHWHDADGKHRMPDPRRLPGYHRQFWSADERAYVEHLEAHEELDANPQPRDDDNELVRTLFAKREEEERAIRIINELIVEHRKVKHDQAS